MCIKTSVAYNLNNLYNLIKNNICGAFYIFNSEHAVKEHYDDD